MAVFTIHPDLAEPKARRLIASLRLAISNADSDANALYAGRDAFRLDPASLSRADLSRMPDQLEAIASTLRAVLAAQSPALQAAE